jgi:hypothetical protein
MRSEKILDLQPGVEIWTLFPGHPLVETRGGKPQQLREIALADFIL